MNAASRVSCFWGLVNAEDFNFIYFSKNIRILESCLGVKLIGSSLFGLISPSEVPRLRKDLQVFSRSISFNGISIRCPAYNFASTWENPDLHSNANVTSLAALNLPYEKYTISMQIITESVILAIFHIDEDSLSKKNINFHTTCFHQYDLSEVHVIQAALNEVEHNTSSCTSPATAEFPYPSSQPSINNSRTLLIYDSHRPQILAAWPQHRFENLSGLQNPTLPFTDFDRLFHNSDSTRFMGAIMSYLDNRQFHRRISFESELNNQMGARIEQSIYVLGDITVACAQVVINDRLLYTPSPSHSRSISFSNEYESGSPRFDIPRKISAPILNSGPPLSPLGPYPNNLQLTQSLENMRLDNEIQSLHKVRSLGSTAHHIPEHYPPRKSFSNEMLGSMTPGHGTPQERPRSRLFSFLPSLNPINLSLPNRFRRNSSKSQNATQGQSLPPISYMTNSSFSSSNFPANGPLPGFSQVLSATITPPITSPTFPHQSTNNSYSNHISQDYPPSNVPNSQMASPLLTSPSRTCLSCRTTTSPEWRRGPRGQKTLCNACGLKYSRHLKAQRMQAQSQSQNPVQTHPITQNQAQHLNLNPSHSQNYNHDASCNYDQNSNPVL